MSLVDEPTLAIKSMPVKSTTLSSDAYVLSIASLSSSYVASSSAPSNSLHFFDKGTFRNVRDCRAHEISVSSARSIQNLAGNVRESLLTCGKDGQVKIWDERSITPVLQMNGITSSRRRALLSSDASLDGLTVAAGTDLEGEDASILYWDPRNPTAPLRVHSSTHSDDITALHFSRTQPNLILSASSDGLLCTTNSEEADEDEAGLHVGNVGTSIAQAGWIQGLPSTSSVWAASDMETFSTWSQELDRVQDVDIRQPSVHRQDLAWVTDYLVGCHSHPTHLPNHDNNLSLFVGTNEGDFAWITCPSLSSPQSSWSLQTIWTAGHTGVVRSFHWDEAHDLIITGGEDARINVWPCSSPLGQPDVEQGHKRRRNLANSDEGASCSRKIRS